MLHGRERVRGAIEVRCERTAQRRRIVDDPPKQHFDIVLLGEPVLLALPQVGEDRPCILAANEPLVEALQRELARTPPSAA